MPTDDQKTQIDRNDDTQAAQGVEQKSTSQRKFALSQRKKNSMKAMLEPSEVRAVIDTREQTPLDLQPLQSQPGTLTTGDYSVLGLESVIAIERKSLPDLIGCVGRDRERFEREVMRLKAYPVRAIVVEATWADIERGAWRGKVKPESVIGSCIGWIAAGVPVLMVGDHQRAGVHVSRMLFIAARRRWKEARHLVNSIQGTNQ